MNSETTQTPEPKSEAEKDVDLLQELNNSIKSKVADSGGVIKDKFVDSEVKKVIDQRSTQLASLVDAMNVARRDLNKIKPDVIAYNQDGSKASENYTKAAIDKRAKGVEKLAKADKVLKKALIDNDYSEVDECIKKLKSGDNAQDAPLTK